MESRNHGTAEMYVCTVTLWMNSFFDFALNARCMQQNCLMTFFYRC